jgi:serine/threonine-protein kinase
MHRSDQKADSELSELPGTVVAGKYHVDRLIGRGGMGAVFQATNTLIGKRVALKFLGRDAAGDDETVARFIREAQAASAVESAHIVQIFDCGVSERGLPFLVMELLQGEDLRARLRRGRLDPVVATRMAAQVLRGLERAHRAGIVHRDLKPDNVFLCERDDDPMFVKIVDFGISKLTQGPPVRTLTRRGMVMGTVYYMSPEQAQAFPDIDGRADIFSVGAMLYEALCGRPPHAKASYEAVLVAICTEDAEDVRLHARDVPSALARVVARALSRDRDARFQSAEAFSAALHDAVPDAFGERAISASARAERTPRTRLQRGRAIVAIVVTGLGVFALTAWLMRDRPEPTASSDAAPSAASSSAVTGARASPRAEPPRSGDDERRPVEAVLASPGAAPGELAPNPTTLAPPRAEAAARARATPPAGPAPRPLSREPRSGATAASQRTNQPPPPATRASAGAGLEPRPLELKLGGP